MTTKALGQVDVAIKATGDDDGPGGFVAVLSTDSLDRDGEVVDSGAFDPLPDKITIDIDHGMSVRSVVASGRPYYGPDGKLYVDATFSSLTLAQDVRTLVKEGHIDRMSATFMNARVEIDDDDHRPHIRSAELLNGALVAIPSNRDAVVLAAKAAAAHPDHLSVDPDTSVDDPAAKAAGESSDVRQLEAEMETTAAVALALAASYQLQSERGL